MKTYNREPQMPQVSSMVEVARAHISRPEVAGFTIGYSSGPPEKRVRGSDHRDHARTEEPITLAGCLTRQQALDLEVQVTAQLRHHAKYDKAGLRYTSSAGGGPRVLPNSPVHAVYLAWASVSDLTQHDKENRTLLDALSK